jgi:hypothetical protein
MERNTWAKLKLKSLCKATSICLVAFLFLGASEIKPLAIKLHKEKNYGVKVEIIHKPDPNITRIYIDGAVWGREELEGELLYTTGSFVETAIENCQIVHTIYWRRVPRGILDVEVRAADNNNSIKHFAHGRIFL